MWVAMPLVPLRYGRGYEVLGMSHEIVRPAPADDVVARPVSRTLFLEHDPAMDCENALPGAGIDAAAVDADTRYCRCREGGDHVDGEGDDDELEEILRVGPDNDIDGKTCPEDERRRKARMKLIGIVVMIAIVAYAIYAVVM